MTTMPIHLRALAAATLALAAALTAPLAEAVTYSYASTPFSWIDASNHAKINSVTTTPATSPATPAFQKISDCATAPPIIDDTISDQLPIGFTFNFAGVGFTQVRVMTNGRLQFNNNTACGYGSPVTVMPYPNANLKYTMRIYGNDLDPSLKSENPNNATYTNTPCVNRAVCFVSYATVGTAPYRKFVVTWSNVPEWVQSSSPVGGYNMQVILQENGEFIYQYGTDVAGPQAKNGEVGWQGGDMVDYGPVPAGFPINNTAIKFYIPAPIAEYRFEQPSKANSPALDTSGNGYTGTMLGGVLTAAGKVCRAATIPANTSAASIDAIDTTVPIQKIGGVGLIDFWYKSNTAWSGTGAKDEQLLDASVSANVFFFLVKRSNGDLRFVITDTNGVHQAVETGPISVAANTWKHIAVSWNFNPNAAANNDKMLIYVDGALVTTASFTTSGYPASQGTLYAGDNRSSVIGQNGSGNSADGAIDELRIYNSDGSGLVTRDYNNAALGCVNHYKVVDGPDGSTCQPSTVTVLAHDLNHANFTLPNNTTTIQLSTSTGRGDWTLLQGYGTLTNGSGDDGTASYLFNGEYQAVFALRHTVAGTVTVHATDGQLTDLDTENQSINIVACGSGSFNACMAPPAPAVARCVPTASSQAATTKNVYASLPTRLAKTAFAIDLVKLKADGTLDTGFNKTVGVELLANTAAVDGATIDPATLCPKLAPTEVVALGNVTLVNGRAPAATGLAIAANAFSNVSPGYSAFRDVRVRFTCDSSNCGSAVTSCSTDAFALRPADFALGSDMVNTSRHAGVAFTLTASATTVAGVAVPGYDGTPQLGNIASTTGPGGIAPSAYYSPSSTTASGACTQGANGSCSGALANNDPNVGFLTNTLAQATLATGVSTTGTMQFDDIGYVGLVAGAVRDLTFTSVDQPGGCVASGSNSASNTIDSTTGLIGCNIANGTAPAPFGRFTVDHIELNSTISNACNGFSYMDQQELGIGVQLLAKSYRNTTLSRYATGAAAITGENTSTSGVVTTFSPLSSRLSPDIPSLTWAAGAAGRDYKTDTVTHLAGSTSIKLAGSGTINSGDQLRFAGDATKYTVSNGTQSAASPITIAPGLAADVAGGTKLAVLHKFTRAGAPDGPYDGFALRVAGNESDGALITVINGASIAGVASTALGTATDGGVVRLRYGRLRINNAYGSEKLDLPITVTAQYYSGATAGYITSTLDSGCTPLTTASFTLSNYTPASTAANMPASNLAITGTAPVTLLGGVGYIKLLKAVTPPAITQKFNVRLNSAIPYLPGSGTETFGMFRAGPVIYMQEVH